jgi:hypothetical protein
MLIIHRWLLAWVSLAIIGKGARSRSRSLAEEQPSFLDQQEFNPSPPQAVKLRQGAGHLVWRRGEILAAKSGTVIERPKVERGGGSPSPPPPSDDRPRDGGADEEAFLRRMSDADALELLEDWISSTKVLQMGGQFGNATKPRQAVLKMKYAGALKDLEEVHDYTTNVASFSAMFAQKMVLGMYSADRQTVLALAAGSLVKYSKTGLRATINKQFDIEEPGRLTIRYISLSPNELKAESSVADLQMRQGLRFMAEELDVELEFSRELKDPASR